jgi:hypothetical protein
MSDKKTLREAVQELSDALIGTIEADSPAVHAMRDVLHLEREEAAEREKQDAQREPQMILIIFANFFAGCIVSAFLIGQLLMSGSIEEQWFVDMVDGATKITFVLAIIGAVILTWYVGYKTGMVRAAIKKKRESQQ